MAIKFERTDSSRPQLPIERDVFRIVANSIYFPQMIFFGRHADYNVLAMDLLGPSVEDLFNFCARKFTVKTIVMIGEQCLKAIEYLHEHSLIHRDLKPDSSFVRKIQKTKFFFSFRFSFWFDKKSSSNSFDRFWSLQTFSSSIDI